MMTINFSTLAIFVLALVPTILGSATSQFRLNPQKDASNCWMDCHSFLTGSLPLEGVTINSFSFIDGNCRSESYITGMGQCLATKCESAPDAAYGAEYAESICKRAGVKVAVELPESYRVAAAEYFQSAAYTSRGVRGIKNWGLDWAFILVFPSALFLYLA